MDSVSLDVEKYVEVVGPLGYFDGSTKSTKLG